MRKEDRQRVLSEVNHRVYDAIIAGGDAAVEEVLADAVYHERRRLDLAPPEANLELERKFWRTVQGHLLDEAPGHQQRQLLQEVIALHGNEIVGRFDPRVYGAVTRLLPPVMSMLLNATTPTGLIRQIPRGVPSLQENIVATGHVAEFKAIHKHGQVILAPTHLSHLDSIVIGWILYDLDLPPVAYGAGLNLFTNPMLSFFMHNLGAYKVDRKKKHGLYKAVLKEYCTVSLENGYNNLFFPGGTRIRSGKIESRLKLGLLGCGLQAYQNSLRQGHFNKKIFIVPATLSYHLVLEAETLIEDFLAETGKSRFVIEDDESIRPKRVYEFVKNIFRLKARIHCSFGKPLDVFGNEVDLAGVSRDEQGRPIDIARYLMHHGVLVKDPQRDREYTRLLGEKIVRSYRRETVLLSTHLTARVLWQALERKNPGVDMYRLLRSSGKEHCFQMTEILAALDDLLRRVRQQVSEKHLRLDRKIQGATAREVLKDALRHFSSYHTEPVLRVRAEILLLGNLKLLIYYQNRLEHYDL